MKKIKIALLVLVMAMLFAACSDSQTTDDTGNTGNTNATSDSDSGVQKSAYAIYMLASEKLDNVESMIMNSTTFINMNVDGETTEMTMDSVIEMVVRSETDMDMRMSSTTKADGMEMPSEIFYRDGNMYMEMMGMQMKMPMPLEDMLEQVQGSGALAFPEEAILSAEQKDVANGTEITFTLSGSVMSEMVDSITGGILANMGMDSASASINMGDIEYVVVIDSDDMPVKIDMAMSMSVEANGESLSMDMTTSMDVVQVGGVTINFPDNLEDFMDMSGMMF